MRFRFVVCDNSDPSIVEGAVDDFSVAGIPNLNSSAPDAASGGTALLDCRPNPFTHETTLRYRLASAGSATLSIYDPAGRLVRRLSDGAQTAGAHSVLWDGRDAAGRPAPAGMYFYELKADGYQSQKKMLMLK
jgi:hypothetical protein